MPEFDLVIKGGTVIDGLRIPRYGADIGIKGATIAYIGHIGKTDGARVIDAGGLIVAPGFIDLHTHYDSQIFWDPWCTISGYHGVTSVVIGNCGFGFAPCRPENRERAMLALSRNEAVPLTTMRAGMPWDWETFPQYLDSLARTPKGVNVMPYIGLSPIYAYAMGGFDEAKQRPATQIELDTMSRILIEAVEAGACGFSCQYSGDSNNIQRDYDGTPMITDTRSFDELATFARALGSTGRGMIQISGGARASVLEATELLAHESGRPVLFNLLAANPASVDQHGMPVRGMEEMMEILDGLNDRGLRVYGQALTNPDSDAYFTLEDYNLFDGSTLWREATLGGRGERLARLKDPTLRAAFREEYDAGRGGAHVQNIPKMYLRAVPGDSPIELKRLEGQTIGEIARQSGKHVLDTFLDLACQTQLRTEFWDKDQNMPSGQDFDRMRELIRYKYSLPGVSDGGAHTKYVTLGCYTTQFLIDWVREHEMVDLEEAHWRLSAYPAFVAGMNNRGFIREGAPADIIVYDFENLKLLPTERTYDFPAGEWRLTKKAAGYHHVIVNGEETFVNGEVTGNVPGRLVSHGGANGPRPLSSASPVLSATA